MNDRLARFDAFANAFLPDRETMIELIDMNTNPNSINFMIDNFAIIDLIDAQFDDDFAIICDIDAIRDYEFAEFIKPNRREFTIYLYARIMQLIA